MSTSTRGAVSVPPSLIIYKEAIIYLFRTDHTIPCGRAMVTHRVLLAILVALCALVTVTESAPAPAIDLDDNIESFSDDDPGPRGSDSTKIPPI